MMAKANPTLPYRQLIPQRVGVIAIPSDLGSVAATALTPLRDTLSLACLGAIQGWPPFWAEPPYERLIRLGFQVRLRLRGIWQGREANSKV